METGRILLQMNRIAADEGIKLAVELNILGKVLLNMDQIVAVSVSYTHLDVYKRQVLHFFQH